MNAALRIALVLAASLAVSAGQAGAGDQAGAPGGPAAPPAPRQGATAPRPGAQRVRAFAPPIDGKITPDQVKRYIAVRRRALELSKQGAPGAPSFQQLAEVVAAETRAAGELSFDFNEYRWVQSRVAEASAPAAPAGGDISKVIEAAAAKGVAQLQKTTETRPPVSGRTPTTQTALAHNRGVVQPFRADLAALEKESPRLGT